MAGGQSFWQVLPGQGRMSILFGSWYSDPIAAFATGRESHERFLHRLERIRHLERMLHAAADPVRLGDTLFQPLDVTLMRSLDVHTFLVGEAFMRAPDPGAELQALFGA